MVTIPKKAASGPTRVVVSSADAEPSDGSDERTYKITLVAAGLAAADLKVVIEERGMLAVTGETKRTGSSISRRFKLPPDADASRATARHVDGILTVTVPKGDMAEAHVVIVPTNVHGVVPATDARTDADINA